MLFNSFEFALFFLAFLAVYFLLSRRYQPAWLLLASYLFYMSWEPVFVLLLLFTTVVDYVTAMVMDLTERPHVRRAAMVVALVINLGILAGIKYGNFVANNVVSIAAAFGWNLDWEKVNIALPIGISFYTFQSIGYTLDVFFRRAPAEKNLFYYAQYVAFFPQLVAGPIERIRHMMPQFRMPHRFNSKNISPAMWLIGWGLFKKMCIADQVAPFVDAVYAQPGAYSGTYTLIATVLFGIQIYCDFSGYSSIARGVARLFGFDLMINFRQPYFAKSLTEFWSRWHISLSTWFRDYLYVPLGGNRDGTYKTCRNILLVFVISGVWHGASWTFVAWGALHGAGLVVERLLKGRVVARGGTQRTPGLAGWATTMVIVFCGWILFRAASISDALKIFGSFANITSVNYGVLKVAGFTSFEILLATMAICLMFVVAVMIESGRIQAIGDRIGRLAAAGVGVALTYGILLFGVFGRHEFIYFQF